MDESGVVWIIDFSNRVLKWDAWADKWIDVRGPKGAYYIAAGSPDQIYTLSESNDPYYDYQLSWFNGQKWISLGGNLSAKGAVSLAVSNNGRLYMITDDFRIFVS